MKSSFSWPGRPPAEMISRNANRLLTSILDGTPKRGAFCTSTLDGTPKRGAFCTSTLDGTLKRGAFCTSTLDGTSKRGAFCTSTLDGTLKRGAFCTSTLDGTLKRGTFCTSTLDGRLKRDAFLCTRVGAYCIRPTKRSRKGTGSAKGDQTCDFLSPTGPFGGAYLGTPYHATSKRDAFCTSYLVGTLKRDAFYTSYLVATPKRAAFCTSYLVATPKRGAFCTSYLVGTLKRGAFCTSYLVATLKRGAFCTSYLVGSLRRGVFCLFYSSFLALMQEKKQKKIKASGMPANFCRVHHWRGRDLCHVPGKLPCLGRGCRPSLPPLFRLLFLAHPFSYVSIPYFPPERVHPDVP